jgi:hypothetical protein
MMLLLRVLIGLALLLLGRKLFWFFVGAIGFIVAMELTLRLFPESASLVAIVAGLVAGVIGALLAIFVQHVAVGLAGLLAGGAIILNLVDLFGLGDTMLLTWALVVVGAIVGLALALALLDWALIVLSSLAGASVLIQAVDLGPVPALAVLVLAAAIGILVQSRTLEPERG